MKLSKIETWITYPTLSDDSWSEIDEWKRSIDDLKNSGKITAIGTVSYTHLTLPTNREV